MLRAEPGVFGRVASDPTVSRSIDALAADAAAVLAAIDTARAAARAPGMAVGRGGRPRLWCPRRPPAGRGPRRHPGRLPQREGTGPAQFKRGYGFHPLCAFLDHGAEGTGEALQVMLRPGNAGSNTATDHIAVLRAALRQLPGHRSGRSAGRKVLVRVDGAGSTHAFLDWLTGQRLSYSVGSACPTPPRTCSPRSPTTCGPRPTTPTTRSVTAPGSLTSPAYWI